MFNLCNLVDLSSNWLKTFLDGLVLLNPVLTHVLSSVQDDVPDFLCVMSQHDDVPSVETGEVSDHAGPGGKTSGFGELGVDLVSGEGDGFLWNALLRVVDGVLAVLVLQRLLDDFLAPELELLVGEELECVEVNVGLDVVGPVYD